MGANRICMNTNEQVNSDAMTGMPTDVNVTGHFGHMVVVLSFFLGRAIKHVRESIFTPEGGARRGIPKVLVVLTDGRSQDDVNKVSKEMQMEGT